MKRFVISFGNSQDKASSIVLNFLQFDEEHQSGLLRMVFGKFTMGHKTGNEVGLCTDMGSIH